MTPPRVLVQNRKARHLYHILDQMEAGIVLEGSELKPLRAGKVSLDDAFAHDHENDMYLYNMYIGEYGNATQFSHELKRPRRLLLHRNQINKLIGCVTREGITLIPLSVYLNARGRVKVELGLTKGKNKADKRETIKERDWEREKGRILRGKIED